MSYKLHFAASSAMLYCTFSDKRENRLLNSQNSLAFEHSMKFKGEEGFALLGLFAGIAGAAIFIGIKSFDEQIPYPLTLSVNIAIVTMFLFSMVIKFSSIFTHHAVFTINGDDFILGSALGFDIPLVVSQFLTGHLPFVE